MYFRHIQIVSPSQITVASRNTCYSVVVQTTKATVIQCSAQCIVVRNHLTWFQILNLMCLTLFVSVEGLEMKENGDLGVFQGME